MEDYTFLRLPSDKKIVAKLKKLVQNETDLDGPGKEEYFLCRQCLKIITSTKEMIEVSGSYHHTFANPEGIVFEIGCFRKASGCGYVGPATEEFSWFKGFRWKVAVCGHCLNHVGWLYVSSEEESFHGLILERLLRSVETG